MIGGKQILKEKAREIGEERSYPLWEGWSQRATLRIQFAHLN